MLAGVPSRIASAASTSAGPADRAGRRTTSTPVISGSVAPRSTASNISAMAGDGVWCTISRVTTAVTLPPAARPALGRVSIVAPIRVSAGPRPTASGRPTHHGDMAEVAPARPTVRRRRRVALVVLVPFLIAALLHLYPWARLVLQPGWPAGRTVALSVLAVALTVGLPAALLLGHGRGVRWAVGAGDLWLGVAWQLFVWTAVGELVRLALLLAGLPDPARARVVTVVVLGWTVLILGWGAYRALGPVPVRQLEVLIAGLGSGLSGLRIGHITDTH